MWEKAFIGDDGSQVRRKRSVRPCGLTSKGLSLCLFELNYRIRGRTLRDESLETNTARDLKQVVRMFVEMDVGPVSPSSTTWYEKKRSETNHWIKPTQASLKTMCVWFGKWTSFLLFRVRMLRMWGRKTEEKKELTVWALFDFIELQIIRTAKSVQKRTAPTPPLPFSPISITIELTRKRSFPYAQKSRSWL